MAFIMPCVAFAGTSESGGGAVLTAEERAFVARSGEITIGCPIDNCPILFENEKTGELDGITIEIMNMIAEKTGLVFRYHALPSGNVTYQDLVKSGVDMVAGVEYNEINKNSNGISMTEPYMRTEKVFVCRKGDAFRSDGEMVIAVASGSQTIEKVIRESYPKFRVAFFDTSEEALRALLNGKADAVLQNQYMAERMLCKPIYEDLQVAAAASIGDSQCLARIVPLNGTTDDAALLISVINKGIAALDRNEVSFVTIRKTVENAYRFTIWDILYRYRYVVVILVILAAVIVLLLRKNFLLRRKHAEQQAAQERAMELVAVNERMKEQQMLLIDSLKQAEEGNRAKTTFLFNISHDIRTPMNAILGFAEIARGNINDTEKLTDCIDKISASGKSLLRQIDSILDMSRIGSGSVALAEENCDLEECIETARFAVLPELSKKNLIFRTDMTGVENTVVCCDKRRVNHILLDIISNAVKFNKRGGSITVTVTQRNCDIREYAEYEIRIADTGIGMSKDFLSRVFEPFERERTSTISKTQGVGLGMAITKNLVDMMGGTIEVTSEVNKGTEVVLRFTFKLPPSDKAVSEQPNDQSEQSETSETSETAVSAETNGYDFSGKRLLLVEDNELNMEIAYELLCNIGFSVETAENGQIAVDMVRNSAVGYYDVILMDIQMPVMDGYQASREIRALDRRDLAELPIIALTANVSDHDKKEALANGMNAHIAKPLDLAEMYKVLSGILNTN